MKKKIFMIVSNKGGVGKSTLSFMLSEKYKEAVVLDLDDATTTTMKQLAYRRPTMVSFLDPVTKRIDRGAFNGLFESVIEASKHMYVADAGSAIAQQLPNYFLMTGVENIVEILIASKIELQIVCVVGGGNIFKATMEYLDELVEATESKLSIIVAHNGFYPMSSDQRFTLEEYTKEKGLILIDFDLVKDKGEMALRTVENVLKDGKGISGLSPFQALYFKKPIADLPL